MEEFDDFENYTVYIIECRRTHSSPWLKPKEPLKKDNEDKQWYTADEEITEPWHGTANNWRPKHKKSHENRREVGFLTGESGWSNLKYAKQGLKRLKKANKNGKLDSHDYPSRKKTQVVRYEFRMLKKVMSQKTWVM